MTGIYTSGGYLEKLHIRYLVGNDGERAMVIIKNTVVNENKYLKQNSLFFL